MASEWKIGKFWFHLISDDIFNLDVESIVNSEQTDFVLSTNMHTISGQIKCRYGNLIQRELDAQTKGERQAPGTVIKTSGGADFKTIYHAGFHDPFVVLDSDEDTNQTEYLTVIRNCYREILGAFSSSSLSSIALPLIGSGLFHLSPKLVTYEFIDQVIHLNAKPNTNCEKHIWLVEQDEKKATILLDAIVQRLLEHASGNAAHVDFHFDLGINFLDLFEKKFIATSDKHWLKWLVVRYFELVVGYTFFTLACYRVPKLLPQDILNSNQHATFGFYRRSLKTCFQDVEHVDFSNQHVNHLSRNITNLEIINIIDRVNNDRNNIAHGRENRDIDLIINDIKSFINISEWESIFDAQALQLFDGLDPWVQYEPQRLLVMDLREVGILDKWNAHEYFYIIPHSGEYFSILQA